MPSRHRTPLPSILLVVVLVALTALPPATAVAAPTSAARSVTQSALAAPAASAALTSPALSTALSGLPQPSVGAMGGAWQAAFTQPRSSQPAAPEVAWPSRRIAAGPRSPAAVPQPPTATQASAETEQIASPSASARVQSILAASHIQTTSLRASAPSADATYLPIVEQPPTSEFTFNGVPFAHRGVDRWVNRSGGNPYPPSEFIRHYHDLIWR